MSQTDDSTTPAAPPEISDKIDSLIILDRQVDMITPLLTQLTYEGLIDELIGIKNCETCVIILVSLLKALQPKLSCRYPWSPLPHSLQAQQRQEPRHL